MNSAKFCYRVLDYLKERFPTRFSVYEGTEITTINLYENHLVLEHACGNVVAEDVILCTNGYLQFSIWDRINQRRVTKLHDSITPRIGYLAAFDYCSSERYAYGFLNQQGAFNEVPFWYFSNAPSPGENPNHAFVIGGPEYELDEPLTSEWVEAKGKESFNLINLFLKTTFKQPPKNIAFFWHGWMGYSADGLRWVGPDPDYPHLWYNLACNGIGIVPAIDGAKKIAEQISKQSSY